MEEEGPAQRARSARELALSCLLKEGVADFKCGARVAVFFQSFRDELWLRLLVFSIWLEVILQRPSWLFVLGPMPGRIRGAKLAVCSSGTLPPG